MRNNLPLAIKNQVLKRDSFTCRKCGFKDKSLNGLEIHHIKPKIFGGEDSVENLIILCSICYNYAPDSEKNFLKYVNEKIDGKILETFRKSIFSISDRTKFGMQRKAKEGGFITKAPKGYRLLDKKLVPSEDSENISKIFEEFINSEISLTQLAKKNSMTTAGIKKLLKNTTYIGKVRFAGVVSDGNHPPIISNELFNKVQDKLEKISFTKKSK